MDKLAREAIGFLPNPHFIRQFVKRGIQEGEKPLLLRWADEVEAFLSRSDVDAVWTAHEDIRILDGRCGDYTCEICGGRQEEI